MVFQCTSSQTDQSYGDSDTPLEVNGVNSPLDDTRSSPS